MNNKFKHMRLTLFYSVNHDKNLCCCIKLVVNTVASGVYGRQFDQSLLNVTLAHCSRQLLPQQRVACIYIDSAGKKQIQIIVE